MTKTYDLAIIGTGTAAQVTSGRVRAAGWKVAVIDHRPFVTAGWTLSLLIMGCACLVNARGCGRTHCYFTGSFFLIMAVVSLTYGLHLLPLGGQGWSYIGAVLLVGGILLCVLPEWVWGRYRRVHRGMRDQWNRLGS